MELLWIVCLSLIVPTAYLSKAKDIMKPSLFWKHNNDADFLLSEMQQIRVFRCYMCVSKCVVAAPSLDGKVIA